MKKQLSLILALVLVFSLFVPSVVSADAIAMEQEENSSAPLANAITNGTIRGKLDTNDDVDMFKVDVGEDDYYTFTFGVSSANLSANTEQGWTVIIYDGTMKELYSFDTELSHTTPRFCIPGTIYVKVEASNSYYAPTNILYDLSYTGGTDTLWENEYNDLSTSANAIKNNTTYRGSLYNSKDADWFKVTTLDYFSVSFNKNMTIPTDYAVEQGWKISIYDTSNNLLESFQVETSATSHTFPVTGTVYVKVEANNSYYAPTHVYYDLKVNSVSNSKWENEYNNSSTTANTIKQGTEYIGNLQSSNDVDFYKVKSTTGAIAVNFRINLNEVDPDYVENGWTVTIYAANSAKSLASYTVSEIGSFESIALPYAKGEYYYVKVEARNSYYAPVGQTYHISVVDASNGKPWEVETGKTGVSSATAIKDSTTIYGNLCNNNDQDYFKCTIPSAGTIKLTFKRNNADNDGKGYKVRIVDAAGKVILADSVIDDVTSKSFSGIKVSKGTYYIIVANANTHYAAGADINYNITYALTLTKPSIKSITPTQNTLKVSWAKKSDITSYQIQYATNSKFSDAKTVTATGTATSTTIKNTSANKAYYIRIRTVVKTSDKTYYSAWSTVNIAVNTPTVKKITPSKGTLKVSWAKNSGASSYQIQYSTSKDFKGAKTINATSNSVTIKNVSKNKTYYVRIRTVVKSTTTYYSLWSSAYSIKAK